MGLLMTVYNSLHRYIWKKLNPTFFPILISLLWRNALSHFLCFLAQFPGRELLYDFCALGKPPKNLRVWLCHSCEAYRLETSIVGRKGWTESGWKLLLSLIPEFQISLKWLTLDILTITLDLFANYKLYFLKNLHLVAGTVPWCLLRRGCTWVEAVEVTASLWVWITISFTHPHSSVRVCKSPDCFLTSNGDVLFICTFAQELWLALLVKVNQYERSGLLSWDVSRRDRKKVCSLNHKSFSTLSYGRRYQPPWLIPFHANTCYFTCCDRLDPNPAKSVIGSGHQWLVWIK